MPVPPSVARTMIQRPKKESYLRSDRMVLGAQSQTSGALYPAPALPDPPRIFHELHRQARGSVCQTKSDRLAPALKSHVPTWSPCPFLEPRPLNSHVQFPKWKHPDLCTISPQLYKESVCIWHPFLQCFSTSWGHPCL